MTHTIQMLPGEQLVRELAERRGFDEMAARAWIEGRTGAAYEARGRYQVQWPEGLVSRRLRGRGMVPPHEAWNLGRP